MLYNKKALFFLLFLAIVAVGLFLFSAKRIENQDTLAASLAKRQKISEKVFEVEKPQAAFLVVNNGKVSPQSFNLAVKEDTTAFDLLKRSGLRLAYKNYEMGVFVEAINDTKNGDDGKFWLYYVNGQMPMKAADKQVVKPGDKVEFRFEKSRF